jgi:hypothetical protein
VTFSNNERTTAPLRFNNASLKGNYAVVDIGHGGQTPQAGVSVTTYDGKGSFSGVTVQDVVGRTSRERVLVRASFKGTYDVGENGTGTGVITTTFSNGSTSDVNIALVITKSAKIGDDTVAEEFSFIHEQLGATTGNLLTLQATRLPDEGKFTNASLRGEYAYTLLGHGGPLPQAGLGVMTYDGAGRFHRQRDREHARRGMGRPVLCLRSLCQTLYGQCRRHRDGDTARGERHRFRHYQSRSGRWREARHGSVLHRARTQSVHWQSSDRHDYPSL